MQLATQSRAQKVFLLDQVKLWLIYCLQCIDAVGWAAGRTSACEKLSGGVLA